MAYKNIEKKITARRKREKLLKEKRTGLQKEMQDKFKQTINIKIENEIWKDIKGYESIYKVSNFGRVKKLKQEYKNSIGRKRIEKEIILLPNLNINGYCVVNLYKNKKKKMYTIHRLVAENFIGKLDKDKEVNHIDADKTNNKLENLELVTKSENIKHAFKNNLIRNLQIEKNTLYDLYFIQKYTLKEIGNMYGYSDDAVRRVFKSYGFKVARNNAKINITKEWLIGELKSGKTQKMIAQEYHISSGHLSELCKKYGLYKNKKPFIPGG